jgi:hypothetical protein
VTGTELGDTKAIFLSGHNEKIISTSAASIQVSVLIKKNMFQKKAESAFFESRI